LVLLEPILLVIVHVMASLVWTLMVPEVTPWQAMVELDVGNPFTLRESGLALKAVPPLNVAVTFIGLAAVVDEAGVITVNVYVLPALAEERALVTDPIPLTVGVAKSDGAPVVALAPLLEVMVHVTAELTRGDVEEQDSVDVDVGFP